MGSEAVKLDYALAAKDLREGREIRQISDASPIIYAQYYGDVVSKERPRQGKGGHMFTPPKTRAFEAKVVKWFQNELTNCDFRAVFFPVMVHIRIYDKMLHPTILQELGYDVRQHGDIDNKAKSILDAANGIMYRDDKQIISLNIARRYAEHNGFTFMMWRAGLSKSEIESLAKHMRANNEQTTH